MPTLDSNAKREPCFKMVHDCGGSTSLWKIKNKIFKLIEILRIYVDKKY